MSINGALSAEPGPQQEIDGYLNVEGSRLVLRGAPLDYLRSTLVFKDGGLRVADLQATHGGDYFTGTGSMRLDGPPRCEGELRAQVAQLAVYTQALAGLPLGSELARVADLHARLRWDDRVLRFEQFQGRCDGAPFMIVGTADVPPPEAGKLELRDMAITTTAGELKSARGAVYFPDGAEGPASVSLVAAGPGDAEVALFGPGDGLQEVFVGAAAPDPLPWLGDETPWADWLTPQSLLTSPDRVALSRR